MQEGDQTTMSDQILSPTSAEDSERARNAEMIAQQIDEARKVLELCSTLPPSVPGAGKLMRKIQAELRFYKLCFENRENLEKLAGNNLLHLSSIVKCALWVDGLQDVLKIFKIPPWMIKKYGCAEKVLVDIVADGGKTWIKVVGRNPAAVLESMKGESDYGKRNLLAQLEDWNVYKHINTHLWEQPQLKVYFASNHEVSPELAEMVEKTGAKILKFSERKGTLYSYDMINNYSATYGALRLEDIPKNATLNIDVSTMIAYVSALTNGRAAFRFKEGILTEQAEQEQAHPLKPVLDRLFDSRKLICCQTAFDDFVDITETLAGPGEKVKTQELIERLTIVPDEISDEAQYLMERGNNKKRPIIVFGVGDKNRAITVTANAGFLRSAAAQSVFFVAFIHPSRALTEKKEATATRI